MEFKGLKFEYSLLEEKILSHIKTIMRAGTFILGPEVNELEKKLADYVGVRNCLTCGNATDALILALMAVGIKKGDAVFVPNFSYIASASCVSILGAIPIFVDIDGKTYNMSPDSLEDAIVKSKMQGYNCRAIITVDLFGQPANYNRIRDIANKHGLMIIEDGAQGFGGRIGEKRACSFGDVSVTSFFPVKPFGAYGDGGAVFSNNDDLMNRIWSLRSHGRTRENKYDNSYIGFNSRLDTLQAAILLEKFELFSTYELERMNKIADKYTTELEGVVKTPFVEDTYYSSWAQYTIAVSSKQKRDGLKEYLGANGVPTMIYYPKSLNHQKALKDAVCLVDMTNGELASDTVLSLPIHPFLDDCDIDVIIDLVVKYDKNEK